MRPSFAVSVLALVVALGGTSYAAVKLAKNSVRSGHIKNGQVKRADIARSAVDSRRIANGTIVAADLAPGTVVKGDRGEPGETGPAGPIGPAGPTGPRGEAGAVPGEVEVVNPVDARVVDEGRFTRTQSFPTPPGDSGCVDLALPEGTLLIEKVFLNSVQRPVSAYLRPDFRLGEAYGNVTIFPIELEAPEYGPLGGQIEPDVVVHPSFEAAADHEFFRNAAHPVMVCARNSSGTQPTSVIVVVSGRVLR